MKVLDFLLEGGHYIIDADISWCKKMDKDRGCQWLRRILDDTKVYNVYKEKDGVLSPFVIKAVNWYGVRQTPDDALKDVAGRITRNETETLTVNDIWPELKEALDEFKKYPAITGDRIVPYFIYYGGDIAKLDYATDRFLYYLYEYEGILMFRTEDGTVVSDNEFAEMGYWESKENVEKGTEHLLLFTEYGSIMEQWEGEQ